MFIGQSTRNGSAGINTLYSKILICKHRLFSDKNNISLYGWNINSLSTENYFYLYLKLYAFKNIISVSMFIMHLKNVYSIYNFDSINIIIYRNKHCYFII